MSRLAVLVFAAAVVTGCGGSGHVTHSASSLSGDARSIDIEMRDTAYAPDEISVRAGETVQFLFRNTGKVAHDAFVGDEHAQTEHAAEMSASSDDHHGEGDAITVQPGEMGALTYTFTGDDVLIGCHEPGHYDLGMKLQVDVT